MINLYLKDCGVNFKDRTLLSKLKSLNFEVPSFASYTPDFEWIDSVAKKLKKYKRMIVIGRGGSITGFKAMYTALGVESSKDVYQIDTLDPDLLELVKENTSVKDTVVVVVSKSGNTVDALENMFFFEGYDVLAITENNNGALKQIVDKRDLLWLEHPPIGGRFSSGTECALGPLAFCYSDYKKVFTGMKSMFKKCDPSVGIKKNPALQLAAFFYLVERKGYSNVFMPIYSPFLSGFLELFMQLIHESSGKKGKGLVLFGAEAPESQHHTNQRLFGGKKNVCACFLREKSAHSGAKIKVPRDLRSVKIRNGTLGTSNGVSYSYGLQYEFIGTQKNATKLKIPNSVLTLDARSPAAVGELIALFEYATYYYCKLLGVDPFNQPHVEGSKQISFELRKKHSKLKRDKYC
ncbi:hypothetical protein HN419_06400 [Candidatus Woesearchaeota archaeon]|jgi:glucose-6-phosphate isomerase|nr:hypothetical protein [Candidatus Woesearchaeota archaeon]MBT3538125.1 hypothetical protein [Candidatus Woesearchaeota archaeon]MBT4697516.1 hypothetical protein [Candidatus Woesearchaeota archaeon]MBT4717363.1 hypothetical protein [Candidatus Woesearchaeota archaeon]MBT7105794.1 hypothetical protein [Candidatus Woesearchaeota archaeon]